MKANAAYRLLGLAAIIAFTGGCERLAGAACAKFKPFTEVNVQTAIGEDVTDLVVENRMGDVTVLTDAAGEVRVTAEVKLKSKRIALNRLKNRLVTNCKTRQTL